MVWIVVLSGDCICRDLQHQISKLDRLKYLKVLVSTATKPSKVSPAKITLWHESFNIPPPPPPVFHGNESHLDWRRWNGIRTAPLSHLFFLVASAASAGPTRWPELKTFHIPTCSKKKTAFYTTRAPPFLHHTCWWSLPCSSLASLHTFRLLSSIHPIQLILKKFN